MSQFLQALQFQQQQAALAQGMGYANQFGYAPGGNWLTWGAGGPTQPFPGTETLGALGQQFGQGQAAAGMTGYYSNAQNWAYQPGTYVRNQDTGQVGQISASGELQTTGNLPPGLNVNAIPSVASGEFASLQQGQGGGAGGGFSVGPTQQATAQAQGLAAQQAGITGVYNQPMGNIAMDAWAKAGPQAQQSYLANTHGDVTTAANRYWADMQGAIQQTGMTPEQYVYGTTGPTPTLPLQQLYGTYGMPTAGQQTLQAINQAAQLSGMYQGAPTEAAREFNLSNALAQGQLGQQYLATAAQLQGPQNTFQLSNYLRGAQGNPNVPVYLQNLMNNQGMAPFQATGNTAPTPQSAGGLLGQMGYGGNTGANTFMGVNQPSTGTSAFANPAAGQAAWQAAGQGGPLGVMGQTGAPSGLMGQGFANPQAAQTAFAAGMPQAAGATGGSAASATPGWDYNQTLNSINQIAQRGAQGLGPGSLERLSPDEFQAFGSGLGAAGYSLPSFMQQYAQSRVGQGAVTNPTALA
jgi:hypothetical protein